MISLYKPVKIYFFEKMSKVSDVVSGYLGVSVYSFHSCAAGGSQVAAGAAE